MLVLIRVSSLKTSAQVIQMLIKKDFTGDCNNMLLNLLKSATALTEVLDTSLIEQLETADGITKL